MLFSQLNHSVTHFFILRQSVSQIVFGLISAAAGSVLSSFSELKASDVTQFIILMSILSLPVFGTVTFIMHYNIALPIVLLCYFLWTIMR